MKKPFPPLKLFFLSFRYRELVAAGQLEPNRDNLHKDALAIFKKHLPAIKKYNGTEGIENWSVEVNQFFDELDRLVIWLLCCCRLEVIRADEPEIFKQVVGHNVERLKMNNNKFLLDIAQERYLDLKREFVSVVNRHTTNRALDEVAVFNAVFDLTMDPIPDDVDQVKSPFF